MFVLITAHHAMKVIRTGKQRQTWQHAVSETLQLQWEGGVQSGHICHSTKLCLLETPGYEVNESPCNVTNSRGRRW